MVFLVSSSDIKMIGQFICLFLLFIFVLFFAYIAARIAGSFQSNVNKQGNIRVIEIYRISSNKTIEIIKIGERYLVVAVCKDNITLLTELPESEIIEQERTLEPIDFKQILEKMKEGKFKSPKLNNETERVFTKKNKIKRRNNSK